MSFLFLFVGMVISACFDRLPLSPKYIIVVLNHTLHTERLFETDPIKRKAIQNDLLIAH